MEQVNDNLKNLKKGLLNLTPYGTENMLSSSSDFINSNTLIAKATFLLLVILVFSFLFYVFSKIIIWILTPEESPYILKGMKDAQQQLIIPQRYSKKNSVPIYRSKNEYDGIEFTYSFWMYIKDVNNLSRYSHVFNKGSKDINKDTGYGIVGPNNAPGVYLYRGSKETLSSAFTPADINNHNQHFPTIGMLVNMNIYNNTDDPLDSKKYYDEVHIDGIPIKKWVHVVIRLTGQNVLDVYINGTLSKRHKLTNVAKQNYDNVNINLNNGFYGNLSNLKYYNYAIGTFEINRLTSNGPNLKMADNLNINKAKPSYLSREWYFNDFNDI
tara:strand:- start:3955 stop:4932 length:978 start_codon:yes stop_codon:yes gene_type:complete